MIEAFGFVVLDTKRGKVAGRRVLSRQQAVKLAHRLNRLFHGGGFVPCAIVDLNTPFVKELLR